MVCNQISENIPNTHSSSFVSNLADCIQMTGLAPVKSAHNSRNDKRKSNRRGIQHPCIHQRSQSREFHHRILPCPPTIILSKRQRSGTRIGYVSLGDKNETRQQHVRRTMKCIELIAREYIFIVCQRNEKYWKRTAAVLVNSRQRKWTTDLRDVVLVTWISVGEKWRHTYFSDNNLDATVVSAFLLETQNGNTRLHRSTLIPEMSFWAAVKLDVTLLYCVGFTNANHQDQVQDPRSQGRKQTMRGQTFEFGNSAGHTQVKPRRPISREISVY